MSVVSRVRHSLSKHGYRGLAAKALGAVTSPLVRRLGHNTLHVGLTDFYRRSHLITASGHQFSQSLAEGSATDDTELRIEFDSLLETLGARLKTVDLSFPLDYGIEAETARALYVVIRTVRPEVVLETGVANGHTSFFITSALLKNGSGTLTSIDITDQVGGVLNDTDRSVWNLSVLDHYNVRSSFRDIVDSLGPIDLFIHDSDHGYEWQKFELETAVRHMAVNGIIACDDADHSYAFLDFCENLGIRPNSLVDARKVFAAVHLTDKVR